MLTWRNETVKIDKLQPASYNPRQMTEKQAKELTETVSSDKRRSDKICIDPPAPKLGSALTRECRSHNDEEHPQMDDGDPTFHTLEVGPEAADRIDAEEIGDECDEGESGDADSEGVFLRPI